VERAPKWTHIIVHHTGAEERNAEQVRSYHLSLGWQDIGYHFVIERDGEVVKGRNLSLPGAHCRAGGMNFKGIGVALIGNLELHPPLQKQEDALVHLLRCLGEKFSIPVTNILGHNEVPGANTLCPGRFLVMKKIREKVQARPANANTPPQFYRVQVGAFSQKKNAEALAQKLQEAGFPATIVKS